MGHYFSNPKVIEYSSIDDKTNKGAQVKCFSNFTSNKLAIFLKSLHNSLNSNQT